MCDFHNISVGMRKTHHQVLSVSTSSDCHYAIFLSRTRNPNKNTTTRCINYMLGERFYIDYTRLRFILSNVNASTYSWRHYVSIARPSLTLKNTNGTDYLFSDLKTRIENANYSCGIYCLCDVTFGVARASFISRS